jgi:hypothetical protein
MKIKMLSTAAGPERVLHAGRCYNLPKDIAEPLLAGRNVDGQPYAVPAPDGTPDRIPPQPDPQDVPTTEPEFDDD